MKMRLGKGWLSLTLSLIDIFGAKDFYIPDQIAHSMHQAAPPARLSNSSKYGSVLTL